MQQGKIKFFNNAKGFGFIVPDDGSKEIFVHATGLVDQVKDNDKVSFEVESGKKGLNAVKVKLV